MADVSKPHSEFAAVPFVPEELNRIRTIVGDRSCTLLDDAFTQDALQHATSTTDFSIVHLATHDQLETIAQKTFILLGDDHRLDVNQLSQILRTAEVMRSRPIELLVLSAVKQQRHPAT